jgi:hypothetical protein
MSVSALATMVAIKGVKKNRAVSHEWGKVASIAHGRRRKQAPARAFKTQTEPKYNRDH